MTKPVNKTKDRILDFISGAGGLLAAFFFVGSDLSWRKIGLVLIVFAVVYVLIRLALMLPAIIKDARSKQE